MPITIDRLFSTISVRSEDEGSMQNRQQGEARPSMTFVQSGSGEGMTSESVHAHGTADAAGGAPSRRGMSPRQADPRKVADRVYELMVEELRRVQWRKIRR